MDDANAQLPAFSIERAQELEMPIEFVSLQIVPERHLAKRRRVHILLALQQRERIGIYARKTHTNPQSGRHRFRKAGYIHYGRTVIIGTDRLQIGYFREFTVDLIFYNPSPRITADLDKVSPGFIR